MAKVRVGQTVVYVDAQGKEKAAVVVGTRKSIVEADGVVARPEKRHAHLTLLLPTGKTDFRVNVPSIDVFADKFDAPVGRYFKPVAGDEAE